MNPSTHKQYLPNLDALRFIAFLGVFMAHACHPAWQGVFITGTAKIIRDSLQVGVLGVNFFFVLSGFLISRLLLQEREATGRLDIFKYYIRRVLRIWPLYFIIVLLVVGYYYFVPAGVNTHWPWIIFFATNFHIIRFGFPYAPALANLWTISVEEQFYLTFPWILKVAGKRMLPLLYGIIIIVSVFFRAINLHHENFLYFHSFSIMSDFAVGALCAWASLDERWLSRVANLPRAVIVLAYLVIACTLIFYSSLFNSPVMIIMERVVLGTMFGFVILEQVFAVNSFIKAGRLPGFSYAGKISYGLYMYHAFALQLAGYVLLRYNMMSGVTSYMFLFPLIAFIICYVISMLSYEVVEKKFLILKNKFELPRSN